MKNAAPVAALPSRFRQSAEISPATATQSVQLFSVFMPLTVDSIPLTGIARRPCQFTQPHSNWLVMPSH